MATRGSRIYQTVGAYRALHNGCGGYSFEVRRGRQWIAFGQSTAFAWNAERVLDRLAGHCDTWGTPAHWRQYGVDGAA
jgi:hypothetical protein